VRARTAAAGAVAASALAAAYALKRFHATASAADLRFVLAPTTWLVEVAGGHRFDWTAGGYLSGELRFLIAPACSGVNFLVVAFAGLVASFVRPARPALQNVAILAASAAAAYAATIAANALRILIAIPLWTRGVTVAGLGGERLHEAAGVAVFLTVLVLLHAAAHRLARAPLGMLAPLLAYAGVVVLVPALRGAHRRPEFWAHAAVVAVGIVAAAGLVALTRGDGGTRGAAPAAASGRPRRPGPPPAAPRTGTGRAPGTGAPAR